MSALGLFGGKKFKVGDRVEYRNPDREGAVITGVVEDVQEDMGTQPLVFFDWEDTPEGGYGPPFMYLDECKRTVRRA